MSDSPQYSIKSTQGRWILLATILASAITFLISTSVSIALPSIQADFETTLTGLQWVVNAYALVLAVLLLISGSLGDVYGRRRIFSIGIGICVTGALLSGFTQNIGQLVVCQVILGLGAAMMVPGSLAIINIAFPETERGLAIGLWSGLSAAVATLGPFVGGWLIQTFGWQWVFLINVPLGILALIVTLRFVPESRNPDLHRLDWNGTFWMLVGLLGICFGLLQAPKAGWYDAWVLVSIGGGVLSLLWFLRVESTCAEPIVPLTLFRNPLVAGANLVTFFLYFALYGHIFFLVINFQQFQHYEPMMAGAAMLPSMVIISVLAGPAGSWADKVGPRLPMTIGTSLVTLGIGLLIIPDLQSSYFLYFLPSLSCFGLGMSLVIAPLTKSALSVESKFSGTASGVNNAVSHIASLMAIAVLGALVVSLFGYRLEINLQASLLPPEAQQQILEQAIKLGGIEIPENFSESHHLTAETAVDQAFLYSFRAAMILCMSLALLSAGIAGLMIQRPEKKEKSTVLEEPSAE